MSFTPRSQIRLNAVTGSIVAVSDIANSALADGQRLENLPAEQVNVNTLEGILGQMGAAIKRIQGDAQKDFTEVAAGVFKHTESVFSGSVVLKDGQGAVKVDLGSAGTVSASQDLLVGRDAKVAGMITGSAGLKLAGDLDVNSTADFQGAVNLQSTLFVSSAVEMKSTLDVDGKATLASAMVENLNVAGGLVFTDASGNLDNDAKVAWNGSQFAVDGAISGSGNVLVGGMITASAGMKLAGDLDVNSTADFQGAVQFQSTINVDGKATVASAQVESLTVSGGIAFNDASGNLQNDSKITWDGSTLSINGALDLTGGIVGSSLSAGRVVYVGADGALTTESGLDYDAAANLLGVSGSLDVAGTLDVISKISGSTAQFSGQVQASTVKVDSLSQPGVVIAGADGLLTTTASLFYTENRLEVSSSVRVSGDMAVNGEGGVADITSTASAAAIFDAGVNTLYIGGDAELVAIGEQGGLVDFAGDVRMTGSLEMMGAGAEFIDRLNGGALTIRGGSLTGSVGKVSMTLSGSDLRFDDGYRSGWDNDIKLAGSQNDWDRFKNIFGEASILQAISNAAALPTDAKFMYKVTSEVAAPAVITGNFMRQVDGTHFSGSFAAVPTGSRNENVDVFLNGQLLVSKSYDAVNYDYDVAGDGSSITFNFDLQPDDFISILVPVTVASVADYVQASGAGGGGGGATSLDGLTDVTVTSPLVGQVLKYNGTAWVNDTDLSGSLGGSGGGEYIPATFFVEGAPPLFNGTNRSYVYKACTITALAMNVQTAASGSSINVRINKNGTQLTTGSLAAGDLYEKISDLSLSLVEGDYLTLDVTQVGSIYPGYDLLVKVIAQ